MTTTCNISVGSMEHTTWQKRARASGLAQKDIARLLGQTEATVSRALRGKWDSGVPRSVMLAIITWEVMTETQRKQVLEELDKASSGAD